MTQTPAGGNAGPTTLVFQAPPDLPEDDVDALDDFPDTQAPPTDNRGGRSGADGAVGTTGAPTELRMLKGARAAAAGMKISDAQIRAVLEDPQEVQPDPKQPQRTQLRRDGLVVTMGNDGMILRVARH